jgi:hypothetical protein
VTGSDLLPILFIYFFSSFMWSPARKDNPATGVPITWIRSGMS